MRKRVVVDCSNDVVRVQQHFRDEVDINNVVKRFMKTGILVDPSNVSSRLPTFGDYSNVDFQSSMEMVAEARSNFELLPSGMRSKFDNDVQVMLDFIADPDNKDEAVKLGLLEKEDVADEVENVPEAAAAATIDPKKDLPKKEDVVPPADAEADA